MAEAQPRPETAGILVLPSSRAVSRRLGPLAWLVLEEFALGVEAAGSLAVETSVRRLAAEFGVGKEAAATALGRLIDLGLIRCHTRRRAGRYAGSSYILDADACRRAGVVITTDAIVDAPCPETPCPAKRDTDERDTAHLDTANPTAPAAAATGKFASGPSPSRSQRRRPERSVAPPHHTTEQSLFDFSAQPNPSPIPEPPTSSLLASTTPPRPTDQPDPPPDRLLPLTPSNQPDALAPGVRRGPVNVAGNRVGKRSALNGNLNAEAGSSC